LPHSRQQGVEVLKTLRGFRHLPDSLLHRIRRRAARRRLRSARLRTILFVCTGNICRSPFAAAAFREALPVPERDAITISSAGYVGPGRAPPVEALVSAQRHGLDISSHRSVLITPQAIRAADLIVVMAPDHGKYLRAGMHPRSRGLLVLGDLDPEPVARRTIQDPWGCEADVFEASYARIQRCVAELVELLTAECDGRP
jgi:protein-tyrosine phosphatase